MKGGSPHINFYNIGMVLLWIAMGLALLSGIDYFRKFLREIVI
jgi:phosphatidylglycerophosphate synthase